MGGADAAPEPTRVLTLRDGRTVSVSLCGDPQGAPVFFLHPGNRHMALALHTAAAAAGLRLIAPDRPGIGGSAPQQGRSVQAYVSADLPQLADQLGAASFGLVAVSAGAMYALAATLAPQTAHRVRGRVTLLAPWLPHSSRAGAAPGLLALLAARAPAALLRAAVGWGNARTAQQAQALPVSQLMTRSNAAERAAFAADASSDAAFKAMIAEWGRSLSGIMQEMSLCSERSARLHFDYARDVTAPLRVFMGTADAVVPHAGVADWARRANASDAAAAAGGEPLVQLVSVPGGTHDGLLHTHKVAALAALADDLRARGGGDGEL